MATTTTYDLYPVQQFKNFDAWYQAVPATFIQKGLIKFGTDKNGKTIFEYANGPDHIYSPAYGKYPAITDKQWMEKTEGFKISDDGRSLVSTLPAGQWNIMGIGSNSKYVISGSGADETVTSYGTSPSSTTGVFSSPIMGAGNVPADKQFDYLHQFTKFAQGVQQNVKSKTVTDTGMLGDISDFVKSLGPVAPIALSFVMPGVGSAIGSALGVSGAVGAAIGNTLLQTTLNGGDLGKALTNAVAGYAGAELGGLAKDVAEDGGLGKYLKENPAYAGRIAQAVTTTALQGGDLEAALKNASLGVATDAATSEITGFKDLPPAVQSTIKTSIQAELQGKDVNVASTIQNAAINGLTSYALNQIPEYQNLDSKTQSLLASQLSTAIRGGDLTADATKWAINQANQEVNKAVKGTPESEINQVLDMPATPAAAPAAGPAPEPTTEPAAGLAPEPTPEPDVVKQLEDAGLSEVIPTSVDTAPMTQQQVDELVGLPQETPVAEAPSAVQEATPSDEFFRSIGIEPSSMTDQAPMSQEEIDALIGTLPEAEKQPTPTTGGIVTSAPSVTAPTSQTATQTAAAPTQTAPTAAQKPQLSSQDILGLLEIAGAFDQPQQTQEEVSPYADIDLSDPRFSKINYLGALGEAPGYLGEDQLSEEDKAMLETIGLSPDEISNILEASGMKGSGAIKPGMGVPEGTFKPAGSRTYDIYRALEKDPAMAAKIRQLPLAGFSDDYTKQFISSAEQALNPAWATYRPGVEVAKSFQPPLSQGDARTAAYVPKYDVNTYTGFNPEKYGASSATTPETIGLVTSNPAYLSDPTAAANMMAHELTHIKQVDPNVLLMEAGGTQQDKQSFAKDLATAMPYLQQKYGYAGGYDTQANAPMSERFADLMGWQFQNNIDFSTDPKFQQMVLNTPERMAAWNASTVPRTTRLDPRDLPPGKIVESDFGLPGAAPKSWLVQQLIRSLLGKQ